MISCRLVFCFPGTQFYANPSAAGISIGCEFNRYGFLDAAKASTKHLQKEEITAYQALFNAVFREHQDPLDYSLMPRKRSCTPTTRTRQGFIIYNESFNDKKQDMFLNCLGLNDFEFEVLNYCNGLFTAEEIFQKMSRQFKITKAKSKKK